jgi:hypothetical protein
MSDARETAPKARLVHRALEEQERAGDWKIQFELDLTSLMSLCGNLQLALRHPLNSGPGAQIARRLIDDVRAGLLRCGFTAHAELIGLGDNPALDYDPREASDTPESVTEKAKAARGFAERFEALGRTEKR